MQSKIAGLVAVSAIVFMGFRDSAAPEIPYDLGAAKAHFIPMEVAAGYTRHFRETRDALHAQHPGMKARLALEHSESFNRDGIAALLNAKDSSGNPAAGVRIYQGLDAAGQTRLVLVPYDARGKDILTTLSSPGTVAVTSDRTSVGAEVVEDGLRCPPSCPSEDESPLTAK
ncbi:hypothetical protein HPC49_14155 [Pyxidicoccus fallax]|uniref:Uncharacterized protein n=1 Tax=Pyxidicoccus fallax TaxID=394095 RepID=A0A848LKC7_9BACT|nr:hypothetical protein [Pyxidicoccus fallax]NMO18152.1 hypothetical protein [Pyxidicoccus fallax]NPC79377.1 hypothetical protein [Pyxidicoccus fallax]